MNIGFWDNTLCERGTTTSLYDYAYYNEKMLGNKSFIFYDKNRKETKKEIIEKFKKLFIVHETDNFKEIDFYLAKYEITHIYSINPGNDTSRISKVAKNCIHCVNNCFKPHGEVYSSIAPWVRGNNGKFPVVPHMINLPKHERNLRKKLNIPEEAIVFGGYGATHHFNISFVQELVCEIAKNYKNIYFLFANFSKFGPDCLNIIHLPMIIDYDEKVEFINTCDAMLWASKYGEVMSLAMGEFCIFNKPIITTKVGSLGHVHLLGDKAMWYKNKDDLMNILINFDPTVESKKDWNAYKEYTPEKVMKKFKEVYLDS